MKRLFTPPQFTDSRCIACLLILLSLTAAVPAIAAPADIMSEFEAYKKQHQGHTQKIKDEFRAYKKQLKKAFRLYKKKTAAIWGRDNVMPRKTNWVSYHKNITQRSIVDFEHGTVEVDIALPADQQPSDDQLKQQLKQNIIALLKQRPDTRSMPEIARQPAIEPHGQNIPEQTPAVLDGQVADDHGNPVGADDYSALAQTLADRARRKTLRGNDGTLRTVY